MSLAKMTFGETKQKEYEVNGLTVCLLLDEKELVSIDTTRYSI